MGLLATRTQVDQLQARLRRARRLWVRLIAPPVVFGGDDKLIQAVVRARQIGLYSMNTDPGDLGYSLARQFCAVVWKCEVRSDRNFEAVRVAFPVAWGHGYTHRYIRRRVLDLERRVA